MPTYQYLCVECNKTYEKIHKMKDSGKKTCCPICGHKGIRVIGDAPGFILKGDGWPGKKIKEERKQIGN